MNNRFYTRLAITNIKSNAKTYVPFVLTSIVTVMVFYIMCYISSNPDIDKMTGGGSLKQILSFGMVVIGFFSAIFLFYTNGFLMKRRKKEIGLYNILGMEKRHIMKVLSYETLFTAGASIFLGILIGIMMSKLILLLLLRMIEWNVVFGFEISIFAIKAACALFGGIFVLTLLSNLGRIHLSQPVELLRGGQVGEREPKAKWLMTLTGVVCLGSGYYIALTTVKPLAALGMFFIAVMLVIVGTYALFTAGSIFILKLLRKNKKFYYKTSHFTSVSGLIYRMKQNAVGLANICILSTIVLVMISTTTSLYLGMEDAAKTRYPRSIMVMASDVDKAQALRLDTKLMALAEQRNITIKNLIDYRYLDFVAQLNDHAISSAKGKKIYEKGSVFVSCMVLADYNKMYGKDEKLKKDEVLLQDPEDLIDNGSVLLGQDPYKIKKEVEILQSEESAFLVEGISIVMADEVSVFKFYKSLHPDVQKVELSYCFGFDTDAKATAQIGVAKDMSKVAKAIASSARVENREGMKKDLFEVYGGLLFIGIFLGVLFIMATVMIIYYKQITEGYEDKERFEIMRKVGMSRHEVKGTIKTQVLIVFFLPLIVAIIHICFAFNLITKLLIVLNLTNVSLFAACTAAVVIVFAVFYAFVYTMTARTYYRIVS